MVAVNVGVGTDDDLAPVEVVQIEGAQVLHALVFDFDAATQNAQQVHDDVRLENARVVFLQAVEDFASNRHDALELGIARRANGARCRVALDDVDFAAAFVFRSAVDELLHAVGHVGFLLQIGFDALARFFRVLAALLVHQHLLADLLGLLRLFKEVDLQVMLEEISHGLRDELVRDGLLGLVLVAGTGGEAGRDVDQAVLHILEADGTLALLIEVLVLQVFVDLIDKSRTDGVLWAAAVLQPGGVVIVFQQLHLIGEAEGSAHPHLIIRLILTVTAGGLAFAAEHRGQGILSCHLLHIVGDTVLVAPALLPGLAGGGVLLLFVRKVQGQARVDHGLTAQHILIVAAGHIDIGKHLIVRLPVDNTAGAAALVGLLLQAAHVLALFKVQMVVIAVTVDISGHPCRGVLGGAQTQTVQAKAELVVILAFAVLAARVHLAEQQLPVEAPLAVVPVHGHTAAKVLHNDAAVLAAGHVDGIAVAVAGFIDRVGHDLKDRVGTALHTV